MCITFIVNLKILIHAQVFTESYMGNNTEITMGIHKNTKSLQSPLMITTHIINQPANL